MSKFCDFSYLRPSHGFSFMAASGGIISLTMVNSLICTTHHLIKINLWSCWHVVFTDIQSQGVAYRMALTWAWHFWCLRREWIVVEWRLQWYQHRCPIDAKLQGQTVGSPGGMFIHLLHPQCDLSTTKKSNYNFSWMFGFITESTSKSLKCFVLQDFAGRNT